MFADGTAHVAVIQVHRADVAAAFDQSENHRGRFCIQRQANRFTSLWGFGQKRFVRFDGDAFATNWVNRIRSHGKANTVSHEPSGFHSNAKRALELARADAFLGRTHQVDRLKPQTQRRVAVLENGADFDRKLFETLIALAKSCASCLAIQGTNLCAVAITAMRAHWTRWPKKRLHMSVSSGFVLKMRGVEYGSHEILLDERTLGSYLWCVK
jgi:hypothetical protein